ncbi:hypothetical protein [uncultured Pontibacter sp.]|uniref:hypothetical protein n=1 Tax=uncultured Pontibacter sp. TaxID=453356 RepID=UPI00262392F9|nr:hypothetical protein [uncultured Pontibacter sp.]
MKNKVNAVFDVLDCVIDTRMATKFFYNVYEFILYNDTEGFIKILDYRMGLGVAMQSEEDYFIFRFMLRYLQTHHPAKIIMLCPCLPISLLPEITKEAPDAMFDYNVLFPGSELAA